MTERKEALEELLAKVEAGGDIFPNDFPEGFRPIPRALGAYYGSLDAAKVLHEAVLNSSYWVLTAKGCEVWLKADDDDPLRYPVFSSAHDIPARAWLIAILKALTEQETTQ